MGWGRFRVHDGASGIASRIEACTSPRCLLEVASDYARAYSLDGLKSVLMDTAVLEVLKRKCWRPEDVLEASEGAEPEVLEVLLEAVKSACSIRPPPSRIVEWGVGWLSRELKYCRSIDCLLVKLGTLVSMLRQRAAFESWDVREALNMILRDQKVRVEVEKLRPGSIAYSIRHDVRHKSLRPYADIIIENLEDLPGRRVREGREKPARPVPIVPEESKHRRVRETHSRRGIKEKHKSRKAKRSRRHRSLPRRILSGIVDIVKGLVAGVVVIVAGILTLVRYAILAMIVLAVIFAGIELLSGEESGDQFINTTIGVDRQEAVNGDRLFDFINRIDRQEVVDAVLEKINLERTKHALPPVELVDLGIAQARAVDMLENKYYGHCDLEGRHPGYYYTLLGGQYAMEENIGIIYKYWYGDTIERVINLIDDMIYDDADSDWGHRDSLLDPTNNAVDIGVAYDDDLLYITIHMQKIWVNWTTPPSYDPYTGKFEAEGYLLLDGSRLYSVIIYYSPYDKRIVNDSYICSIITCTCDSYDLGEPVAGVVPDDQYYYPDIETVVAKKWVVNGEYFRVEFQWKPDKPGIYTIMIWATNPLPYEHPYDPDRYNDYIVVLEYSFEYEG